MGSPFELVLFNTSMGYCEAQISEDSWPMFYNRFKLWTIRFLCFSRRVSPMNSSRLNCLHRQCVLRLKERTTIVFLLWMFGRA